MAEPQLNYPISAFQLRGSDAKEVFDGFHKIADEEFKGRKVDAFKTIVKEATAKRNGKKK